MTARSHRQGRIGPSGSIRSGLKAELESLAFRSKSLRFRARREKRSLRPSEPPSLMRSCEPQRIRDGSTQARCWLESRQQTNMTPASKSCRWPSVTSVHALHSARTRPSHGERSRELPCVWFPVALVQLPALQPRTGAPVSEQRRWVAVRRLWVEPIGRQDIRVVHGRRTAHA